MTGAPRRLTIPELRRINRGKSHSYEIDGRKADGATTTISNGYPKPGLMWFPAKRIRRYVMDRWDEFVAMTPSERDDALYRVPHEYRDEAAERGKRAHDLIMRLARGEEVEVADELKGYVDAYEQFVEDWQPVEVLVEAPVFSLDHGYGGTLDVVAALADGLTWLLDWKTGADIYNDVALQLAAYRYADVYLDANGVAHPMPTVDACGSVWIQDGTYALKPIQVTEDTYDVFLAVQHVAHWRAAFDDYRGGGTAVGEALNPPRKESA